MTDNMATAHVIALAILARDQTPECRALFEILDRRERAGDLEARAFLAEWYGYTDPASLVATRELFDSLTEH